MHFTVLPNNKLSIEIHEIKDKYIVNKLCGHLDLLLGRSGLVNFLKREYA